MVQDRLQLRFNFLGVQMSRESTPSQQGFLGLVLGLQTQAQPVPIASPAGETSRRGLEMGNSSVDKLCSHVHSMNITQQQHYQQRNSKPATSGLLRERRAEPTFTLLSGEKKIQLHSLCKQLLNSFLLFLCSFLVHYGPWSFSCSDNPGFLLSVIKHTAILKPFSPPPGEEKC